MSEETEPTCNKAVLSLDVGTTTVKAIVISKAGRILGKSQEKVNYSKSAGLFYKIIEVWKNFNELCFDSFSKTELAHPQPDCEEIDHSQLWVLVKKVINGCIKGKIVILLKFNADSYMHSMDHPYIISLIYRCHDMSKGYCLHRPMYISSIVRYVEQKNRRSFS